jgi:hypothetical protein
VSTMISEVYDAFKEAGVSEEKARKAAEAIAAYDTRFANIDLQLAEVRSVQRLHSWMLGTLLAGVLALVLKAFA